MRPSQSAITLRGWGFHIVRGVIDPGEPHFRPRSVAYIWKDFWSRESSYRPWMRRDLGPRHCPEGELSALWLHEAQPISDRPMWVAFQHRAGQYQPWESPSSSPGCWYCRSSEGFLVRGWEIIITGCDGTSTLPRGATLTTRRLHEVQPVSFQRRGWVSTPRGAVLKRVSPSSSPGWNSF